MRFQFKFKYLIFSLSLIFTVSVFTNPTPAYADSAIISALNDLFPKPIPVKNAPLQESDLANLLAPGIVRILQNATGTITIYSRYDLDWKTYKITPVKLTKPVVIPVNDSGLGTGFIITPDGYIVTNAHVVSESEVVYTTLKDIVKMMIEDSVMRLSAKDQAAAEKAAQTPEGYEALRNLGKNLRNAFMADVKRDIKVRVTVLDPTSTSTNIASLEENGFPAEVVKVDEGFLDNQRDVAIIKIKQEGLPAIPIARENSTDIAGVGSRIHIFGFPASADFSRGSSGFVTPTFSSGTISAFKDSTDATFKLIQTDSKSSSGSSGSPFLNEKGEVIGIMTYITTGGAETSGDIFSFAIPLNVILPFIKEADIIPRTGNLYSNFISGLNLLNSMHCKDALSQFDSAKSTNTHFPVKNFIDSYVEKCKDLQASGKSIDSDWDQLMLNLKSIRTALILTIGGLILFVLIFITFFFLIRRLRKDEARLNHAQSTTPQMTQPPSFQPQMNPSQIPQQTPIYKMTQE